MRTYTRDELAALLGIEPTDFRGVVAKDRPATQQSPRIYELKMAVDTGERRPARYVVELNGRGFGLFPTLQSARLWAREESHWEASSTS